MGTSRSFVVGVAAGAGAFALLVATSRGPVSFRGHDPFRGEPPGVEEFGAPVVAPAPVQPAAETAADQRSSEVPVADPRAPAGRAAATRNAPPAVDPPRHGSTSTIAALQPAAVAAEPEERPSRSDVEAIDQQLARSRAEAQLRLQQDLNDQVAAIRLLVAQDQARREAETAAAQEDVARKESAVDTLLAAEGRLRTGDCHVLDMLDEASPALPLPAHRAVQRARAALESEDLYNARYWVAVAIAETQHVQLGR